MKVYPKRDLMHLKDSIIICFKMILKANKNLLFNKNDKQNNSSN